MSQIQLQTNHQKEVQWIRLLQIYVLHWRRKRETEVTCQICKQRVVELRLPIHPCSIPRSNPTRVPSCSTCLSFGQELEKLGRVGSLSCPFCQKQNSDVKTFEAHLRSHGVHEKPNLVPFLNRPTNALFKVVLSREDVGLNSILKFLCSTSFNQFKRRNEFRRTTICPFCLVKTSDLASHLLYHRDQKSQVSDSARAATIENFRHHCLTCHYMQLFSSILYYFNQLRLKAAEQNRAPLLKNANEVAWDLEELHNRCRDPPYASCSYCVGFKTVFLHQLYNKGDQIVVEGDRVLYSCSLLDGKWRSDAFESLNLLIRHMLYAYTDIKHTEPRLWRDDPIFIVTFMMKQAVIAGGSVDTTVLSDAYYTVFNQSLLKWCSFCFKPTRNWFLLVSHVAREHGHIFPRNEPSTPQDALALSQIRNKIVNTTRKLNTASTVQVMKELFTHLRDTHDSTYTIHCQRCQFFATQLSNSALRQGSVAFTCIFCGLRENRFDRTVVHIQVCHQVEIVQGIHLEKSLTPKSAEKLNMDNMLITLGDLLTHIQSHPPLECDVCNSLSDQLMNSEFRSVDGWSFSCIFCPNHRSVRFEEVIDHICANHSQNALKLASAKRLERERREPWVKMTPEAIVLLIANSEDMGAVKFHVKMG